MLNYKLVNNYLFTPILRKDYDGIVKNGPIIADEISKKIQPIFTKKIKNTEKKQLDYGNSCYLSIDDFTIDKFNGMINEYINELCSKLKNNGFILPLDSVEDFGFCFDPFIIKQRLFGFFGYISIRAEKE